MWYNNKGPFNGPGPEVRARVSDRYTPIWNFFATSSDLIWPLILPKTTHPGGPIGPLHMASLCLESVFQIAALAYEFASTIASSDTNITWRKNRQFHLKNGGRSVLLLFSPIIIISYIFIYVKPIGSSTDRCASRFFNYTIFFITSQADRVFDFFKKI